MVVPACWVRERSFVRRRYYVVALASLTAFATACGALGGTDGDYEIDFHLHDDEAGSDAARTDTGGGNDGAGPNDGKDSSSPFNQQDSGSNADTGGGKDAGGNVDSGKDGSVKDSSSDAKPDGPIVGFDSGFPGFDSGFPGFDAGLPGFDAGFPGFDAGLPGFDSGLPGFDAGGPSPFDATAGS